MDKIKEMKPLVSIVTVSYNAVDIIEKTILSVLKQTYVNIEYLIIDGGSTDGTVDIIKKYADRITYWISEPDEGIYAAMNKGVRRAKGEWINFMNSGDSFYADNIVSKVFREDRSKVDFMVGIAAQSDGSLWKPVKEDFTFEDIFYGNEVNHQSSFIRRTLFQDGGYDTSKKIIADELFFVEQIVFKGKSYITLPYIICNYDITGISSRSKRILQERFSFMKEYLPDRILADYEMPFVKKIGYKINRRIMQFLYKVKSVFVIYNL